MLKRPVTSSAPSTMTGLESGSRSPAKSFTSILCSIRKMPEIVSPVAGCCRPKMENDMASVTTPGSLVANRFTTGRNSGRNLGPHQIEVGHRQGTRHARTKRNKFASFGNRDDALEVANADSAMKESSPDPPVLQRLPGLRRVIRKRREAGVPAVGKTVLLARRVPGVRETADPQRGIKAGKPDTPKASPAAVCLIASMLASVSNACLIPPVDVSCCPAVTFNTNHDVFHVVAKGDLEPFRKATRKYKNLYPVNHPFEFDERDREDAALSASILAGSVMNSLKNIFAANATTSVIPCLVVVTVSARD